MSELPLGMIMLWSGEAETIPAGWHICDGTEGTIDLRDKFVVGAGGDYAVGQTGGSATYTLPDHTHGLGTAALPANSESFHMHTYQGYSSKGGTATRMASQVPPLNTTSAGPGEDPDGHAHLYNWQSGWHTLANYHGHAVSGSYGLVGASGSSLPPYHALYYIQKVA